MQLEFDYMGWASVHTPEKRVVCLPSLEKNIKTNFEIPIKGSFEFGTALEWQAYLLEYVFEFLEANDLKSASLVNPIWKTVAKREFKRRIAPEWVTFSYNSTPRNFVHLQTSPGLKYNNSAMSLIFYCPDMIRMDQYVWLDRTYNAKTLAMNTFAEYIDNEIVASRADYCVIPCSKIIATSTAHVMNTVIYHGIFIPYIPNIRTTMFYCDTEYKEFPNIIKDSEQVQCILMFNRCPLNEIDDFFDAVLKRHSLKTVAVGGGLTNKMNTSTKNDKQKLSEMNDLFCIAFVQENKDIEVNFNAYSLLFHYKTEMDARYEELESEIIKLKKSSLLRKHGIIFSFCYFLHYRKTNSAIIEKHFPNYPVLGLGLEKDEVFGWNTISIPQSEIISEKLNTFNTTKTEFSKSLHNKSLSLVLITWGKKL